MTRAAGPLPSTATVAVYVAAAAIVASVAPLVAYAGSLALCGAPHALAELRYVDGRFSRRLGAARGVAIGAVLLGVVVLRSLVLGGGVPSKDAVVIELGLVAVLAFTVVPDLAAHPGRALVAVGVGGAIAVGSWADPVTTVVVLAILHNATPVGFLAEREELRGQWERPVLLAFVAVPALLVAGGPAWLLAKVGAAWPDATFGSVGALRDHLRVFVPPALVGDAIAPALFSAAAYLQLLHYGIVLGVLPRLVGSGATAGSTDAPLLRWPRAPILATGIVGVGACFAVAFFRDFAPTRAAYGLLASVHAWIEVPVLLLALAPRAPGRDAEPAAATAASTATV